MVDGLFTQGETESVSVVLRMFTVSSDYRYKETGYVVVPEGLWIWSTKKLSGKIFACFDSLSFTTPRTHILKDTILTSFDFISLEISQNQTNTEELLK